LLSTSFFTILPTSLSSFVLGHFNEAYMIIRTVIENYVCFKIILEYKEKELWKYWIVHSEYISSKKFKKPNGRILIAEFIIDFIGIK